MRECLSQPRWAQTPKHPTKTGDQGERGPKTGRTGGAKGGVQMHLCIWGRGNAHCYIQECKRYFRMLPTPPGTPWECVPGLPPGTFSRLPDARGENRGSAAVAVASKSGHRALRGVQREAKRWEWFRAQDRLSGGLLVQGTLVPFPLPHFPLAQRPCRRPL